MPPPTQRWIVPVGDRERPDREREVEVAVPADPPERAHRRAAAHRLELGDRGRPPRSSARPSPSRRGTSPRGSRRARLPSRSVPSTVETMCSTPASSRVAMSSGQRTDPGSQTRERSLRSRSTIITCSAASFSDARSSCRASARPRALDRHRPDAARRAARGRAPARRTRPPSRRRRTASRMQRPQRRERAPRAPAGSPANGAGEVLDEVDLVDVAARDRVADALDRVARTPPPSTSAPTRRREPALGSI